MSRAPRHRAFRHAAGMTLIELMVALLLGLLVVGGALSVFASNTQTYRATENLGRVQENARVTFELMSRDLREAAGNPCDEKSPVLNTLGGGSWWNTITTPVQGFENGALAGSSAGTDALQLQLGTIGTVTVTAYDSGTRTYTVDTTNHGVHANDIIMVCGFQTDDRQWAGVVKVTSAASGTTNKITHASAAGWPTTTLDIARNPLLARFQAHRWYVGDNPQPDKPDNRSLYEVVLSNGAPSAPLEIADGVQDMQLTYLETGKADYEDASAVSDWNAVIAVRIALTLESQQLVGTQRVALRRTSQNVVNLRNRVQ